MKIQEAFKKFWASIYWKKVFYCLYISKRCLLCIFVWADCGSDVIV